ncbi:MAG TPA: amidohydrolase [Solirubrobacterales bacterium]|nr:amidohydrolase [Solirubrobacterales bacterium]
MSEEADTLTVANAQLDGKTVGVRCVDGLIDAIGPEVAPLAGDETLDAGGAPLVPPLINGHTHAAMTLFRGSGGDLPLMPWLEDLIWPIEAKLDDEDVYWGARLACAEMIRTGTTRFWDMYWRPAATARAVTDAGMRATVGAPLFDANGDAEGLRASAHESLAILAEQDPRISPALAPHAIYTVSEESLRWIAELGAERGLPIQIHLSETANEVEDCIAAHGVRPAHYLDRLGMLSERTVLAHGVWLDPEELALIAERGATVVTNPVANMKLAVGGVFPHPAAKAAGVAVGLGTDGAGSNDSLDLLSDLKAFALAQKHAAADPTAIDAAEAWAVATGARAPLLGAGALTPGEPADFLLLRGESPALGVGDLTAGLVYAASGAVVDTTVVAGRVLMKGGELADEEEIVARAAERARRLGL